MSTIALAAPRELVLTKDSFFARVFTIIVMLIAVAVLTVLGVLVDSPFMIIGGGVLANAAVLLNIVSLINSME